MGARVSDCFERVIKCPEPLSHPNSPVIHVRVFAADSKLDPFPASEYLLAKHLCFERFLLLSLSEHFTN